MIDKFRVITGEHAHVVATQRGHGASVPSAQMTTSLVAGPNQTLHKIEFEVPHLTCRADVKAFHQRLAAHLRK